MNMHGFLVGTTDDLDEEDLTVRQRVGYTVYALRYFVMMVLVPTAILAFYYYAIAADQYQSESHFIMSASNSHSSSVSGFGALLGLSGGSDAQGEMQSVPDYLRSHDAVTAISKQLPLVQMFRRPEADALSSLASATPTPEQLLRYYRGKVDLTTDKDTGIISLKVKAFRPDDAYALNRALLGLGEKEVNAMNQRSYRDAVAMAESQVRDAAESSATLQREITSFRQSQGDVDPQASGEVQIKFMADLRARIVEATSQLATMRALIKPGSPQYVALEHRVASLNAQLSEQEARLAGGNANMASSLGHYEELKVRQDFAAKRYDATAAALEKARDDAQRQQLYLVRVVDADKPVQSLFPQRAKIILTVFIALSVAYGIAWLVLAGVREHAA